MERSVFCINNYNNPTFHRVVLALLKVNEVSYRMLRLFVHPALPGALMCSPDKVLGGWDRAIRKAQAWPKPDLSAKAGCCIYQIYTRHVPWPRVALLPASVLKDGEKRKKKKWRFPGGPVVQCLRLHLPLKKAQVRSHIPTMWRIMMLCGEPYEFTQHLPGACSGGETRPVGEQDYIFSPFLTFSVKVSWKKWSQGWDSRGQRKVG